MKKLIFSLLVFSLLLSTAGCIKKEENTSSNTTPVAIEWMSFSQGLQKAKQEGKPVMVDFYADWCGPCRMMDQITYEDEKVIEKVMKNFVPVKVDVDVEQNLAYQFGIYSIPTIVYLNENGQEVYRTIGYRSTSQILADMNEALSRIT